VLLEHKTSKTIDAGNLIKQENINRIIETLKDPMTFPFLVAGRNGQAWTTQQHHQRVSRRRELHVKGFHHFPTT
jgi:hypothetical protein